MKIFFNAVTILIAITSLIFYLASTINLTSTLALYFPKNENFALWQFVSYLFMHGGLSHLLFNMFALWMFGSHLEKLWGSQRFVFFYLACGVGAGLVYTAINTYEFNTVYAILIESGMNDMDIQSMINRQVYPTDLLSEAQARDLIDNFRRPMVGASGAIYGMLVAYAFNFPNNKLMLLFFPYPIAVKYLVPVLISVDLFSGITGFSLFGGSTAYFAHVGGALIGFIIMLYWKRLY